MLEKLIVPNGLVLSSYSQLPKNNASLAYIVVTRNMLDNGERVEKKLGGFYLIIRRSPGLAESWL